jgi:hypothetical protein
MVDFRAVVTHVHGSRGWRSPLAAQYFSTSQSLADALCAPLARLLKAAIYPLDDDITPAVVADDVAQLERIGAVHIYAVEGREYVHIPSWRAHQHPNRAVSSSLPPCGGGVDLLRTTCLHPVRETRRYTPRNHWSTT